MSSNSSGSVLLAGNVNTDRRRRGRRPPEEDANPDSTSSSLGLGVSGGAVSDCVGWRRAESTHVEHLPVPEVVITDDEEEEEGCCSLMTEDATVYRTALSGSPSSSSSGKTSFKTAEDTVKRSSSGDCATPVVEDSSSLLSVRTGFSAKLLFSVGKRKSLLPRAMAQRTVLAGDSGEEDDESRDTVPDLDIRGNPRRKSANKSRAGRRRSILGRNEVILISSESDEDSDGGAGASMEEQRSPEAKVESWIAKSPLGSPGVRRGADAAETGSFFQLQDDDDDDKSFSPQSERTSKRSFQVRTLTFVGSSEEDEDYDSRRSHRSEDTSKNFSRRSKDNSKSNGSSEATSGNFDKSVQASFEDDSTTLSEEATETSAPLEKSTQASFADTSAEESETSRRSDRDVGDESIAEEKVATSPRERRRSGERDSLSPEPTTTSVRRGRRCSSSSEEGDLEDYFKKLRIMREQARAAEEKEEVEEEEEPMENFIVDDSDLSEEEDGSEEEEDRGNDLISDEAEESDKTDESSGTETEEEDEECEEGNDVSNENSSPRTSPPKREKAPLVVDLTDDLSQDKNADIEEDEELPDLDTPKGRKNPPPRRKPPPPKKPAVVPRTPLRPANLNGAADKATLSFLESLSLVRADDGCHPLARKYVTRFRANRDDLTAKLYRLYNEEIFHGALDPEMTIEWSNRLLTTAGLCHQKTRRFGRDSSKVQCTLFA